MIFIAFEIYIYIRNHACVFIPPINPFTQESCGET